MKNLLAIILLVVLGPVVFGQTYFGPSYIHLNNGSNCVLNYTLLDGAIVGTDPADHLIFTHLYGPDFIHGVYMTNSHGLWHTGTEWSIFDETGADIDTNLAFNVLNPNANGTTFTHTVTVANSMSNWSVIDHPLLNNNASAVIFISKTWDNGVYDAAHVGVWYDAFSSQWAVYNEDSFTPLEINSTYNIFVPDAGTSFYKHMATSNFYITELDHPLLNGNPDARIFIAHDFTNNSTTQGYINKEIGVWYSGSNWTIYNEDPGDTLFFGATFNVLIIRNFPVGITNQAPDAGRIKVTPNPARDRIRVLLDDRYLKSLQEIQLVSMDGQTVLVKTFHGDPGEQLIFDLPGISQGLYILRAVTGEGTLSVKVNVVR